MKVPAHAAHGVVAGTVDRAYRRWARPYARAGGTQVTVAGVLRIVDVQQIDPATLTDADAQKAGETSLAAMTKKMQGSPDDPVFKIDLAYDGPDPRQALAADAALTDEDVQAIGARLARLDAASSYGPWTLTTLRLIEAQPARLAAELAEQHGRETAPFKIDVRKLKGMGLTRSLPIGYELSERGAAYLGRIR